MMTPDRGSVILVLCFDSHADGAVEPMYLVAVVTWPHGRLTHGRRLLLLLLLLLTCKAPLT